MISSLCETRATTTAMGEEDLIGFPPPCANYRTISEFFRLNLRSGHATDSSCAP